MTNFQINIKLFLIIIMDNLTMHSFNIVKTGVRVSLQSVAHGSDPELAGDRM